MIKLAKTQLSINAYKSESTPLFGILHAEYEWRKVRGEFIQLQPCCQMCGGTKELNVHHIYPWHLFPHLRYHLHNLLTLCRHCHFRFGHNRNWKAYNPKVLDLCKMAQAQNTRIKWDSINKFDNDLSQLPTTIPIGGS